LFCILISFSSATGNEKPPKIRLNGIPFEKCYILNTETINEGLMWRDNLGAWSAQNKRPSCRRYELDEDFCMTEYGGAYVLKKQYAIHPYTEPPNSLSKCLSEKSENDYRWFAYFLADAIESTVNDRVRSIVVDSEAAINQISAIPLFMRLVDCISEEVFKERLEREKENWELLCSGFTKKFWSNIVGSRLVFSGYLLPARFTSGLGVGRVIANPAENTNARLKIRLQNLQCTGLHVIIHMLEERYERTRLKRCIIKNEGELELTGKYADFSVSKEEWSQMSPLQKLCAWRKICIEEGDSSEIMSSI
uniref:DUF659 domain-containing protein n=1 Tax=Gongylonema pulchrum TaxID=637853 RepID=A0A183ENQ8_9BILA